MPSSPRPRLVIVMVVVALSASACRRAPSETLPRPPERPMPTDAEAVPPLVVAPPPVVPFLHVPEDDAPPSVRAVLPPVPVPVNPGRPLAGGEPLRLADLAMTRGDPRDAAAQYRALLGDPRPEVAAYVRWRLARAHLALGDRAGAEPLLREVAAATSPTGWAALLVLAELLAERDGATAAMAELRARAGGRADDLEAHLILRGRGPGRIELLLDRAARAPAGDQPCACALAALALDPNAGRAPAVNRCYMALASGRLANAAPPVVAAFTHVLLPDPQHAQLAEADEGWSALDHDPVARARPAAWLALARRYLDVVEQAPATAVGERASWSAVAAVENAARIALVRDRIDHELIDAADAIADRAHAGHRPYARAIRDALVHRLQHGR